MIVYKDKTYGRQIFIQTGGKPGSDYIYPSYRTDWWKEGETNVQWIDYKREIFLTNDDKMVHSATKMRPKQAKKTQRPFTSNANMRIAAEISTGDQVRYLYKNVTIINKFTAMASNIIQLPGL